MTSHLTHRSLYFRYSLIAVPLSFVGLPLYIHIPKFYYDFYEVELQNLGMILLLLRLTDAFLDPFIGYVSDRNQANLKQIMILGGILLIIGFNSLFWAPSAFGQQGNMNFSLWQFINKTALAITSGLLFLFLLHLEGNPTQAYSSSVLLWSYALIPCMIKMIAMIILYMSPIDLGREKK